MKVTAQDQQLCHPVIDPTKLASYMKIDEVTRKKTWKFMYTKLFMKFRRRSKFTGSSKSKSAPVSRQTKVESKSKDIKFEERFQKLANESEIECVLQMGKDNQKSVCTRPTSPVKRRGMHQAQSTTSEASVSDITLPATGNTSKSKAAEPFQEQPKNEVREEQEQASSNSNSQREPPNLTKSSSRSRRNLPMPQRLASVEEISVDEEKSEPFGDDDDYDDNSTISTKSSRSFRSRFSLGSRKTKQGFASSQEESKEGHMRNCDDSVTGSTKSLRSSKSGKSRSSRSSKQSSSSNIYDSLDDTSAQSQLSATKTLSNVMTDSDADTVDDGSCKSDATRIRSNMSSSADVQSCKTGIASSSKSDAGDERSTFSTVSEVQCEAEIYALFDDMEDDDCPIVDDDDFDPWVAAKIGNLEALEIFHKTAANDWSKEDKFGNIPLYYACHSGAAIDLKTVVFLLDVTPNVSKATLQRCRKDAINEGVVRLLNRDTHFAAEINRRVGEVMDEASVASSVLGGLVNMFGQDEESKWDTSSQTTANLLDVIVKVQEKGEGGEKARKDKNKNGTEAADASKQQQQQQQQPLYDDSCDNSSISSKSLRKSWRTRSVDGSKSKQKNVLPKYMGTTTKDDDTTNKKGSVPLRKAITTTTTKTTLETITTTASIVSAAKSAQSQSSTKGQPKIELIQQGSRCIISNHTKESVKDKNGTDTLTVTASNPGWRVFISQCDGITVVVKGKCNSIVLENCTHMNLIFDSVISTCEIVNCQKAAIQTNGVCPSFSIDKSNGVLCWLSVESAKVSAFSTSMSTEMNVSMPQGDDGDRKEIPIPEQFVHRLDGSSMKSTISQLY